MCTYYLINSCASKLELNTFTTYFSVLKEGLDLLHNHSKGKSSPNETVLSFRLGYLISSEDPSHKYFWKVETLPALGPEGKICCWCIISVWSSGNLEENTGCSKCLFSLSNCHGASIFCTLSALESSVYLEHIYMMRACFRILNPLKNMAIKMIFSSVWDSWEGYPVAF